MDIIGDAAITAFGRLMLICLSFAYFKFWQMMTVDWVKEGKRLRSIYSRAIGGAIVMGVLAWGTAGMVLEDDGDPLFGGASYVQEHKVTSDERHSRGLVVFFVTLVLGCGGVVEGADEGRWHRLVQKARRRRGDARDEDG